MQKGASGDSSSLRATSMQCGEVSEQTSFLADVFPFHGAPRLHELLRRVFLLTSIRAGTCKLDRNPVAVDELLQERLDAISLRHAERRVKVSLDVTGTPSVNADKDRLTLVLDAVMDNALRFATEGGTVDVGAECVDDEVHVTISDNGPGIDPAARKDLFEPFVDSDVLHHTSGQGLSLALARAIMTEYGGSIDVTSEVGVGSKFSICLGTT